MWDNSNKTALKIMENECPYCHEHLLMNKRSFANHIRWCKSNPNYEEIKQSTIKKCKAKNEAYLKNELGKLKKFKVTCSNPKCGKEFFVEEREKQFPLKEKYFCCRSCANSHEKTEETKRKTSESVKNYMRKQGFNIQEDSFQEDKVCLNCGKVFHTKKVKQKFCCIKCGREYRNRQENYEKYGQLSSDSKRLKFLYNIYKNECQFKFSLNSYPKEFNFDLINENGWYCAKNHGDNLSGVSRDHRFSINEAFKQKIDPYYISHPANCELLIHNDNSSKRDKCSITKDELIKEVNEWNEKYGVYENKIDYLILKEYNLF